jgi:transposase
VRRIIDTGKNTLHLIGLDDEGTIVLPEKLSRSRIATRFANVPRCLIGIEAGMATHYVARELIALGHDVRKVPPAYAKPFRQAHKNDFRDAYAIAEAVQRPSTRCVPVKTDDQLDLQALHRVGSRLIAERTAVINQNPMITPNRPHLRNLTRKRFWRLQGRPDSAAKPCAMPMAVESGSAADGIRLPAASSSA